MSGRARYGAAAAALAVATATTVAAPPARAQAPHDPIADIPFPAGAPWPQMRRDRRNTGRSPIVGTYRGGRPWSVKTGKGIFSSPVVDRDGTVYVGSADGIVYAASRRGRVLWRFRTGGLIDASGVLMGSPDSLVVGSGDETLYRLRLGTHLKPAQRIIWRFRTPLKPATGQVVNWWEGPDALAPNGDVLAGNTGGGAHRITPDGKLRWVHQAGNSVWTQPATADDGTTYWGSVDRTFFALDPAGKVKWSTQTLGFVVSSPAIGSDGTVYEGSFDGKVYALDPATGLARWTYQTRDHVYSSPALAQDASGATTLVVVGSTDGAVYGLDPATGAARWRYDTGDPVRSSPVIGVAPDGGQIVYVGSSNGRLYALDAATGRRRWSFDTTPADPVLRDRNDLNASPSLDQTGIAIGGEHGYIWHVPYDWCLTHADSRCSTDPGDEFPADLNRVPYVSPGGSTLLGGPAGPLPAATMLTGRLVVRQGGQTVDAGALALPSTASLMSAQPDFPFTAQISGDGAYLFALPDGFLAPDRDYALTFDGSYLANGLAVGNESVGGTSGGRFHDVLRFHTAPLGRGPTLAVLPRRTSALEITRLAVPLPPLLPSVNQIGFDSYDLIAGLVRIGPPDAGGERHLLLWVIGARHDASGRLVADPKGGFAFPLEGRLLGDQVILRRDGLTLHFSFGDVPLRRFELRGTLDRHQTVGPGASLYAEATCTDVPNYGPLLYLTGICNLSDTVAAAGTYVAHRYDPSGGASRRPVGVTVTDVALHRPASGHDGEVVATLAVARRYPAADHLVSVLLIDADTGRPVGIDYAANTTDSTSPAGDVSQARVRIPAGTALPAHVRAIVMADAYPLAARDA